MKPDIHPQYFEDASVTCACGNSFHIGATQKEIGVEICAACHPFYTGQKKLVDTGGRVERFEKLSQKSKKVKEVRDAQKASPKKKKKVEVISEREWKKIA